VSLCSSPDYRQYKFRQAEIQRLLSPAVPNFVLLVNGVSLEKLEETVETVVIIRFRYSENFEYFKLGLFQKETRLSHQTLDCVNLLTQSV